jgi:Co/Zn/Cd efflux system component
MAHHQKAVAAAAALNSGIFAVEAVAGYQVGSLALLMDSVHNLSDEMALVFLYLAFILPLGVSRNLLRSANVFNSVGLIAVSALLLWQAIDRVLHPMPINGAVPIIEVSQSHEELIWPEKIVCGHADHDDAAVTAN